MNTNEPQSYREFWIYYLKAHSHPVNRLLHYLGTSLALCLVALGFSIDFRFLILAPVLGYGLSWAGHFFIENNKPATFGHPFWSLYSDFKMYFLFLIGQLQSEIKRTNLM